MWTEKNPERFLRHVSKQVLLPAGALHGIPKEEMVQVRDVYNVVKAEEAEVKEHQAECVWVYDKSRTRDDKDKLVSCVNMLQFLVPKKLLAAGCLKKAECDRTRLPLLFLFTRSN